MDQETKKAFGLLLGQMFRIQKKLDQVHPNETPLCQVEDGTIYGLLNGMENVINQQMDHVSFIPEDSIRKMGEILLPYLDDPNKPFNGYYDIQNKVEMLGISRNDAVKILHYFWETDQFKPVLKKMDTSGSPGEFRKFDAKRYI